MNLKDIKIGVLGGGVSGERDISLLSANEAYQALLRRNLDVTFIDICTSQKEEVKELIKSRNIELAFITLHGEFGEDGGIQQILEELETPYTGSGPKASFLAMDKVLSKDIFIKSGLPVPRFEVCSSEQYLPENVKYPVVIKPNSCGSSLGVTIVRRQDELSGALAGAFSRKGKVMAEEYIEGRELTVGILGDMPLAVVEIIPKEGYFDFENKYVDGKTEFISPAGLADGIYGKVRSTAYAAFKALGCRHFGRVDIRLGEDGVPYLLEVNSIPGLTSRSLLPLSAKVYGINFDDLTLKIAGMVLHEKKEIQKV